MSLTHDSMCLCRRVGVQLVVGGETNHPSRPFQAHARQRPQLEGVAVDDGETALHSAVINGYKETCQVLVAAGADVLAPNVQGQTPLDLAKRAAKQNPGSEEHKQTVEYLESVASKK